jgi:hypothetical protein
MRVVHEGSWGFKFTLMLKFTPAQTNLPVCSSRSCVMRSNCKNMHGHMKKATAVSVLILSVLWLHGSICLHGFDSGAVDQESQKCSRYTIKTIDEVFRDFCCSSIWCVHE